MRIHSVLHEEFLFLVHPDSVQMLEAADAGKSEADRAPSPDLRPPGLSSSCLRVLSFQITRKTSVVLSSGFFCEQKAAAALSHERR